jgi:hypothetical protein
MIPCPKTILILLVSVLLASCTKHSIEQESLPPAATTRFYTPLEGQVVPYGDSITIKAIAYSSDDLHGYELIIRKEADTTVYLVDHFHYHSDTLNIASGWRNHLSTPTSIEAELIVALDDLGHTQSSKLHFKVQ